jgi:hypothetical protein
MQRMNSWIVCSSFVLFACAGRGSGDGQGPGPAGSAANVGSAVVARNLVIADPGERGPDAVFAEGIAIRSEADEAAPAEPVLESSYPQQGAGFALAPLPEDDVWDDRADSAPGELADDAAPRPLRGSGDPEVAASAQALSLGLTTVYTKPSTAGVPTEPTLSVGRSHVVVATRNVITILSKGNRQMYADSANNFFAALGLRAEMLFDCRATYAQGRHVVLCLQNWVVSGDFATGNNTGRIVFAVSKNGVPNGPADFFMWHSPNPDPDGNATTRNDGDFPFIAVTDELLVVAMIQRVPEPTNTSWNWIDSVRVFSLEDLKAGAGWSTLRQWSWSNNALKYFSQRVLNIVPATHYGIGQTAYLISQWPGAQNGVLLWKISNPFLATRSLTVDSIITFQHQHSPCRAQENPPVWFCTQTQPDNNPNDGITPSQVITHHEGRFYAATYRNGKLWFVRDQVELLASVPHPVVRYGVIDVPSLSVQVDSNYSSSGRGQGHGGIAVTSVNDAVIPFVRLGNGLYTSVRAGMLNASFAQQSSIELHQASFPFVRGMPDGNNLTGPALTPYDIGVSAVTEMSEDAVWFATQSPDRAPASQTDWNVGLVWGKIGGVQKADLTVPKYGGWAQAGIGELPNVNRGATVTIPVRIENYGDGKAFEVDVKLYLSTDSSIGTIDRQIGIVRNGPLSGGSVRTINITGTVPANMTPGSYFLGVMIAQQTATEYDTGNNSVANDTQTVVH